jgi:two-component system cell cycle response regulator DivK
MATIVRTVGGAGTLGKAQAASSSQVPDAASASPRREGPDEAPMSGRRILLVEDNPLNRELLETVLVRAGYEVLVAPDGESALAAAHATHPDLILMDLELPGLDGLEATRRLKADPATRGIPILALTAYAMRGDEERARRAGCDGYLTKPINRRTLLDAIASCLPGGREAAL